MERDIGWKRFFSDDERYADVINGLGCNGRQVVNEGDLQELDTQTGFRIARILFENCQGG